MENKTDIYYEGELITLIDTTNVLIPSNTTSKIFTFYGGIAGKNYEPGDRRNIKWELNSLYLNTSDTTKSRDLANKTLWDFESKNLEGIYKLILTEDLLK